MEDVTRLVLRYRVLLKAKGKSVFKGKYFVSYMASRPEVYYSREELVSLIRTHYASASSPETYIIADGNKGYEFGDNDHKYTFLDIYLAQLSKNPKVINLRHIDSYFSADLPVFYLREHENHPLLSDPMEILKKLRMLIDKYISKPKDKPMSSVGWARISKNEPVIEQCVQLAHLLPFINPKVLLDDLNSRRVFMLDLSAVMKFYILIEKHIEPSVDALSRDSRAMKAFNQYQFNIAGTNLFLKDVEKIIYNSSQDSHSKIAKQSCFGFLGKNHSEHRAEVSHDINRKFYS